MKYNDIPTQIKKNEGEIMITNDKIFVDVLEIIKNNTQEVSFNSWFQNLELHLIDEDLAVVYLGVSLNASNHLTLSILQNRYLSMIEAAFESVLNKRYRVVIKNSQDYMSAEKDEITTNTHRENEYVVDDEYTFENFIVGDNNKYAYSASLAVAETPGTLYNPLFIYGESGLGKTHLLKGIGSYIHLNFPEKKIEYVSSEKFTNELIQAIKEKQIWLFKEKYRKCDVLIIDDIQFLEGKEKIQEEFFHTFNTLHDEKKQIVISSDKAPDRLQNLDKRLQNRFQWSLMAEIQAPAFDTRVEILTKKAVNLGLTIDEDILEVFRVISKQMTNNVRELEGALTRLIAFSKLLKEDINMKFARNTLTDIFAGKDEAVTSETIKRVVCEELKVSLNDMDSSKRDAAISKARQLAMYLVREMTVASFPEVGKCFNGKHYTTVIHACKKIEEEITKDSSFRSFVQEIKYKIKND